MRGERLVQTLDFVVRACRGTNTSLFARSIRYGDKSFITSASGQLRCQGQQPVPAGNHQLGPGANFINILHA